MVQVISIDGCWGGNDLLFRTASGGQYDALGQEIPKQKLFDSQ